LSRLFWWFEESKEHIRMLDFVWDSKRVRLKYIVVVEIEKECGLIRELFIWRRCGDYVDASIQ
jgi:hypothetical protein